MPTCKAYGCKETILDGKLMCRRHWFLAPEKLRIAVWREYRQEAGSGPHIHACYAVQLAVAVKENRITEEVAKRRIEQHKKLLGII